MKKIKILSLILAVIFIFSAISLVSCDSSTSTTNNSSNNNSNEYTPTQAPTEQSTEAPPHTEHEGAGTCSVCGINYLDTLISYIKSTGEEKNNTTALYYTAKNGDKYTIRAKEDYTALEITNGHDEYSGYWAGLWIDQAGVKYGEYSWDCHYYWDGYIKGLFFASASSSSYASVEYQSSTFSSESKTAKAQSNASLYLRLMISDVLLPLLEDCGHNLTPSDFGFERFE